MATIPQPHKTMPDPSQSRGALDPLLLVELIKSERQEIYHSRQQNWKYWAVLGVIVAGLFSVAGGATETIVPAKMVLVPLSVLGTLVSILAAINARRHGALRMNKSTRIASLERQLAASTGGMIRADKPGDVGQAGVAFATYITAAVNFALWPRVLGATNMSDAGAWALLAGESAVVFLIAYVCFGWSLEPAEQLPPMPSEDEPSTADAEPEYATVES